MTQIQQIIYSQEQQYPKHIKYHANIEGNIQYKKISQAHTDALEDQRI